MTDLKWRVADLVVKHYDNLFTDLDRLSLREGHSDADIIAYLSFAAGSDLAEAYVDWIEEGANNG